MRRHERPQAVSTVLTRLWRLLGFLLGCAKKVLDIVCFKQNTPSWIAWQAAFVPP